VRLYPAPKHQSINGYTPTSYINYGRYDIPAGFGAIRPDIVAGEQPTSSISALKLDYSSP
jgi:hypothetical protein